jgi:CPA2 family monovalent cation:H+ antiporter-2
VVATEPSVLIQAHIMHARLLVITDGYFRYSSYCRYCQTIKPQIQVLICAESKEEAVIRDENIGEVFYAKKKWQRI